MYSTKPPGFGHPKNVISEWRSSVTTTLALGAQTPFFLFSPKSVSDQLAKLDALNFGRPVRHWYSCKTQPLAAQLRWWNKTGRGAEVVSEAEFCLAASCGFNTENLLVNGPAKQRWLAGISRPGLRVNMDSPTELREMLPLARQDRWQLGIRLRTPEEFDPGMPELPTQFGFEPAEAVSAIRRLRKLGMEPETLHFHLRTNLATADCHARALNTVVEVCQSARFCPKHLDIGGGLPPPHTLTKDGSASDARFRLTAFAAILRRTWESLPGVQELWLENGRYLLAGSGVLCIRILEAKRRGKLRQLIADGGRTLHALVSIWEDHELLPLVNRGGRWLKTAVYGPTCMAFDQLALRPMSQAIRPGDCLLWLDAGAYHLPWENRFSHPLAEIWWKDGETISCERRMEGGLHPS